jgi:hypothetical protein
MDTGTNHREFTRITTSLHADVQIDGIRILGHTQDVSLKGMLFRCAAVLPVGRACIVTIRLGGITPDAEHGPTLIEAAGRVVRSAMDSCAIEFTEFLGVESYQHLTNLLRYNAHDPDKVTHEIDSHLGLKRIETPPAG